MASATISEALFSGWMCAVKAVTPLSRSQDSIAEAACRAYPRPWNWEPTTHATSATPEATSTVAWTYPRASPELRSRMIQLNHRCDPSSDRPRACCSYRFCNSSSGRGRPPTYRCNSGSPRTATISLACATPSGSRRRLSVVSRSARSVTNGKGTSRERSAAAGGLAPGPRAFRPAVGRCVLPWGGHRSPA